MKHWYIYDRASRTFLTQVEAENGSEALMVFASEMKLVGCTLDGDTLLLKDGRAFKVKEAPQQ